MSDILARIDGALDSHAHTAAEVTGNPWPGRVPSLDEMLEAVFGPEDGGPVPSMALWQIIDARPWWPRGWVDETDEAAECWEPGWNNRPDGAGGRVETVFEAGPGATPVADYAESLGVPLDPWQKVALERAVRS